MRTGEVLKEIVLSGRPKNLALFAGFATLAGLVGGVEANLFEHDLATAIYTSIIGIPNALVVTGLAVDQWQQVTRPRETLPTENQEQL